MTKLFDVYALAKKNDIKVYHRKSAEISTSIEIGKRYAIFINETGLPEFELKIILAHEVGHCVTGATHCVYSPFDLIAKHEYKADKYAIHKLLPFKRLMTAIKKGFTEIYELAEYFDVPEDFIRKALRVYDIN